MALVILLAALEHLWRLARIWGTWHEGLIGLMRSLAILKQLLATAGRQGRVDVQWRGCNIVAAVDAARARWKLSGRQRRGR